MEHISKSGRVIPPKTFSQQLVCPCKKKCAEKIDIVCQKEIFDTFYNSYNWTNKTLFLRSCITRHAPSVRKHAMCPIIPLKKRDYTFNYSLVGSDGKTHQVCQSFFKKCLQLTNFRIHTAASSIPKNPGAIERRGRGAPANKTRPEDKEFLKIFINCFPRYKSHYTRKQNSKEYLPPNLNIKKLYEEYKTVCDFRNRVTVSEYIFRDVFNKDFNLAFKRPKKDTCNMCNEIKIAEESSILSENARKELKLKKLCHRGLIEETYSQFKRDVYAAKQNETILCLTFDLQKTLECPSLNTSTAYYKRQLWVFNLCIYDEGKGIGFMYVWHEAMASRGAQEIGSCLLHHLKENVTDDTKRVILYSDSCSGQNRNIKITLLLKHVLENNLKNVKIIDQKYFVPGHSFNSCDRSFATIEKEKKMTGNIYSPDEWIKVIQTSKKKDPKFVVYCMEQTDFFSSRVLEKLIINRKKTTDKKKINWFKIRMIQNFKGESQTLNILQDGGEPSIVSIAKSGVDADRFATSNLPLLFKNGKAISKQKFDDLIFLTQKFVPDKYHDFYKNLKYGLETEDDGLASCSENDD